MNFFKKISQKIKRFAENPSFTLKEQLGFAAGSFGYYMGQDMIGTFIIIFLTDYMGIKAAMLLLLMTIAKVINALADPIAGALIDRTNTRWGKSRPYLLLTPFPLVVTSILLFVVPNISYTSRLIWVFSFYIIYCLADTFYDMSLLAVSARMSNNPNDRKNFYTFAEFAGTLGSMLPGGLIPVLISVYSHLEQQLYLIGAIVFGVLGLGAMIIPFFTLREKNLGVILKDTPAKINAKAIMLNGPLIISMIARIIEGIRQVSFGALAYFYRQTLGAFWLSTVIGFFSASFSYVSIALVPYFGKKHCARDIMIGGYFFSGFFYLLLHIVGYSNLFWVGALIAFSGATTGLVRTTRNILIADSIDYMEWRTWKKFGEPVRSEGMVFAMNSFAGRINTLLRDLWLPTGLIAIGYISAKTMGGVTINVVQEEKTLNRIFYLVTIPGIVGNFVSGGIFFFDTFRGEKRAAILAELAQMRAEQAQESLAEQAEQPIEGAKV